jgi:hypothetical protein
MQHFNTLNDLILFACTESEIPNAYDYHKVINADCRLSREYKSILKLKNYLYKLKVGPSEFVIKNVLNYSKALSVTKTHAYGNIGLLMN